jgi:hypothetical protein
VGLCVECVEPTKNIDGGIIRMNDSIANTYSDARSEYTKQLCQLLVPSYFQWYLAILEKARELASQEPKKLLWHFQTLLNDIPEWNMEKVNTEISQLQTSCGCDYMEDLLTAVFIAHTKVLTSIRVSNKQKKVQITVPKVEHFLFKVLCESSKLLWGSSFLFREGISSIDKQQNYRAIETLLSEGILQAVRNMIPVKSILRDFVSVDDDDDDQAEDATEDTTAATATTTPSPSVQDLSANEVMAPTAPIAPIAPIDPIVPIIPVVPDVLEPIVTPESIPTGATSEEASDGSAQQLIVIDTDRKPSVNFANYNSVFDSDHPEGSDMVEESEDEPGLEIMEDSGVPLDMGDVEDLDKPAAKPVIQDSSENLGSDDFDVLV